MTIDDGSGKQRREPEEKGTRPGRAASGSSRRGGGGGARKTGGMHEVERYERLFASRTKGMRSSAMRDMMSLTERPEVISLAGGLPETRTFPAELYAKLMSHVAASETAKALQYGPTEGIAAVISAITQVMAAENTSVDPDEVIVTTGGQQVIDLVCKALLDPHDIIISEAPTYPGAVPTFGAYEADVIQLAVDGEGMPIDALEELLAKLHDDGRRPKFIYTIPNFQNPGGVTMSLARRRRLVEIAREQEILILEDNPYGLLRYEGVPLSTLYSLDAELAGRGGASDFVIYLGTFSKILSPGVRLGWAVAPIPVLEKLNLGKQGADLCSSPVTQLFVAAYFADQDWHSYLDSLKTLYRRRRDVMLDALESHLGTVASWTHPEGGMFIWATLPQYIDTTDLLARALASEDVAFVPGRAAYVSAEMGASSMRLNFAGVPEEDIVEAVKRIGKVVFEQVELFSTMTGTDRASGRAKSSSKRSGKRRSEELPLADVVELRARRSRQG